MKLQINKNDVRVTDSLYGTLLFVINLNDLWETLGDKKKTNALIHEYKRSWDSAAMEDTATSEQQVDYYMNLENVWKFLKKNKKIIEAARK